MEKTKNFFNKIYKIIAYTAIFLLLVLVNYCHILSKTENISVNLTYILFVVVELIIFVLINKVFFNKLEKMKIQILTVTFIVLFCFMEIVSVYYFRVKYNWDFKWIMDSAMDIATTGTTQNIYYFKIFPNNLGALIVVTIWLKIFSGNVMGAYILNIISVLLAVIFSVLTAKKIGGEKLALNTIILLFLCAPLYLYSPIIYTDTLSVAIPVMTLYFWILAEENKTKSNVKHYMYLVFMVIISVIGYCIKPVAAIVFVAIIIDSVFSNKKVFKDIMISLILFICLTMSYNKVTAKFILKDNRKNDLEFPTTHWIMMGLGLPESEGGTAIGYGAYSQKDADFTSISGSYTEKKNKNIEEIKLRIKNFGTKGYLKFLYNKFKYVWNDGTYYALSLIGWDTLNTNSIPYRYVLGEKSNIFRNSMTYLNNALFIFIIVGLCVDVFSKKKKAIIRILGISLVGIAIFLLVWEARSRYIFFLIPVFAILGAIGIENICNCIKFRTKEEVKVLDVGKEK